MYIYICNTVLQALSYHAVVRVKPYKSPYITSVNGTKCIFWGFKSCYDKKQNKNKQDEMPGFFFW